MDKVKATITCSINHARLSLERAQQDVDEIQARIDELTRQLECEHIWVEDSCNPYSVLECSKCEYKILADILEEKEEA